VLVRWMAMLAALLTAAIVAGSASAGVRIQLFQAGVEDSVGIVADNVGNVYVLSEFMMVSKVAPDGTRVWLPFEAPALPEHGPSWARALVWGPDDALWFTCNGVVCHVDADGAGLIDSPSWAYAISGIDESFWSVDSTSGTVKRTTMGGVVTVFQGLPVGLGVGQLVVGPDGKMWFVYGSALVSVTSTGVMTSHPLPPSLAPSGPMAVGSDGNFWMAIANGIARVTPDGEVLGQYPLADTPTSLVLGPDGDVWFAYFRAGGVGRVTPSGHVGEFSDEIGTTSQPAGIVRAADGGMWIDAFYRPYVWRIDPDPPSVVTEAPGGIGATATTLNATVDPRGGPTSAFFEYGTTTAYGSRTASRDLGDGEAGVLTSASLTGLRPTTTYHYRVVAVNGMRTVRGEDRTLTTTAVPVVPPRPPVLEPAEDPDVDGDGYPDGVDCDDHAAAVHPGAVDRPGDAIDQDCTAGPAPWGHLAPPIDARWATHGRTTRFTRLTLGALPAKATISLACHGGGCSFKSDTLKLRAATKHLNLLARLERSQLRRGTVIELRLAASGQATTVIRWRIGPPTRRTTTCLAPGARKEGRC
jgi:virginiamycin B lyase